jgi:hypothetical protein
MISFKYYMPVWTLVKHPSTRSDCPLPETPNVLFPGNKKENFSQIYYFIVAGTHLAKLAMWAQSAL